MQTLLPRSVFVLLIALSLLGSVSANDTGVRTLYLVRHGHYDPVRGADDKVVMGLNALGREQAALLAERLATFPVRFTALTSSELTRARETADVVVARLGTTYERTARLNETLPPGRGIPSEQTWPGATEHLEATWKHYSQPLARDAANTHELLVCHGVLIRWLVCRALDIDPQLWTQFEIANCSITMVQVRADGSTRVQGFNDIAHVPAEKQTWSGRGPTWPALPRGK